MLAAAGSAQAAVFLKKRITSVTAGAGATFFLREQHMVPVEFQALRVRLRRKPLYH